ncbi:hypothetical protein [Acetoanaerobium noterae]|uniref:hypothetical protein n=1 Tax=Acetoanaerobium noterae TaxID=745369 RepID=UPI0028AEF589|nr:hypothetical protein [Acetoanaerobium noterae]
MIAILGIIAAVAVPRLTGFKRMAEERVCASNRKSVERMYLVFLVENDVLIMRIAYLINFLLKISMRYVQLVVSLAIKME